MTSPWTEARFLSRPNRFLVRVVRGRRAFSAFLPNPGRLEELLLPRAILRVCPAPDLRRKTRYDVLAVRSGEEWVSLDTRLANATLAAALDRKGLPEFEEFRRYRREVSALGSRFDFLLEGARRCWLEVKHCSLVRDGTALFPDAPTERGVRHLEGLSQLARQGDRAACLFLVVRSARSFAPNEATDPAFASALRSAARDGVEVYARRGFLRGRNLLVGRAIPTEL